MKSALSAGKDNVALSNKVNCLISNGRGASALLRYSELSYLLPSGWKPDLDR